MNWQLEFKEELWKKLTSLRLGANTEASIKQFSLNFIETEIIEKLIEDIPDKTIGKLGKMICDVNLRDIKKQLKTKWLLKE